MQRKKSQTGPTYAVHLPDHRTPPLVTEWLLTNGIGGYAMGTAIGCNTRRYHGLLIAPQNPPVERFNTINSLGEILSFAGHDYELFTHEFASGDHTVFHANGWRYLTSFEKDLACRWTWQVGPVTLTKQLRLLWQRNIAVVDYTLETTPSNLQPQPTSVTLRVMPFVSLRDFHHLRTEADPTSFYIRTLTNGVGISAPGAPGLNIEIDRGTFNPEPHTWQDFRYRNETQRGQDDTEALLVPGVIEHTFDDLPHADKAARTLTVAFGTEEIDWSVIEKVDPRRAHLRKLIRHVTDGVSVKATGAIAALATASDDFVVRRSVGRQKLSTILAGYPWFADWGRDTMISLPGLLLCTGRFAEASRTLTAYAEHIRDGLIPNRFDDYGGEPHYNTVDASLWFVHAALRYLQLTDDTETWRKTLRKACREIIDAYRDGASAEIAADGDGLIIAGSPATQLTWMDAKRDGVVFTPRHGKAVEINALWYNALCGLAEAPGGRNSDTTLARKVKRSFNSMFWDDGLGYLLDHVNEHGADPSLRPNQVFAVSLPHSPLSRTRQKQVMQVVRDRLLTPMGLRTLPTDDPNFHPRYGGTMFQRDRAYHQGTVWAWLIGPYVEGWLRAHQFGKAAIDHGRDAVAPLIDELSRHSLGQLHEVFDGTSPHHANGCIAQAWSVAETLRAMTMLEAD